MAFWSPITPCGVAHVRQEIVRWAQSLAGRVGGQDMVAVSSPWHDGRHRFGMLSGQVREARMVLGMNLQFDGQFGNYQNEIYFKGLSGVLPTMPMTFEELEGRAQAVLSPSLLSYVAGGAGDESTQRANVSAFQRWGLVPWMMVGATRWIRWSRSRTSSVKPRGSSRSTPRPTGHWPRAWCTGPQRQGSRASW